MNKNIVTVHYQSVIRQNSRMPTADTNTVVGDNWSEDLIIDILDPVTISKSSYRDIKICPLITTEQRRYIKDPLEM